MENKIKYLFYTDICLQLLFPIGAFWYFGYTDLAWVHKIIPGQEVGVIGLVMAIVSLILYIPTIIKNTKQDFPKKLLPALKKVLMPLIFAIIIGWISGANLREWFIISGSQYYTIILITSIVKIIKNQNIKISFKYYLLFLITVFSILLFQLAALPVYLQNSQTSLKTLLLIIAWFGSITQSIILFSKPTNKIDKIYTN